MRDQIELSQLKKIKKQLKFSSRCQFIYKLTFRYKTVINHVSDVGKVGFAFLMTDIYLYQVVSVKLHSTQDFYRYVPL
jgi:phage-related protein